MILDGRFAAERALLAQSDWPSRILLSKDYDAAEEKAEKR